MNEAHESSPKKQEFVKLDLYDYLSIWTRKDF